MYDYRLKARAIASLLFAGQLAVVASDAAAWDGAVSGKIAEIHTVSEVNNYELRITLQGGGVVCAGVAPGLSGWAYMNSSDTNYRAMLANLMLAFATSKTVTLYTMNEGGIGCHLHYAVVSG